MCLKNFITDLKIPRSYPKVDDANLKCTLLTVKQYPALKMRVRYGISIFLLLRPSCNTLSGYAPNFLEENIDPKMEINLAQN